MKRSSYSKEQVIGILGEPQGGAVPQNFDASWNQCLLAISA